MPTFWVVFFAEMEITNKRQCSQQALGCNVSKQEIRSPESEEQLAKAGQEVQDVQNIRGFKQQKW